MHVVLQYRAEVNRKSKCLQCEEERLFQRASTPPASVIQIHGWPHRILKWQEMNVTMYIEGASRYNPPSSPIVRNLLESAFPLLGRTCSSQPGEERLEAACLRWPSGLCLVVEPSTTASGDWSPAEPQTTWLRS